MKDSEYELFKMFLKSPVNIYCPLLDKDEEIHDVAYRFKHMIPIFQYVKSRINKKKSLWQKYFKQAAFHKLEYLYYEHLTLLCESVFDETMEQKIARKSPTEQIDFLNHIDVKKYGMIWVEMLENYPVLRDLVMQWNRDFICHVMLIIERINLSHTDIDISGFHGLIVSVGVGDSDLHQGQCVHILDFEDSYKIVYKPRNLNIDMAWQRLLNVLTDLAGVESLYTPKVWNYEEFGLVEYIESKPVEKEEDFSVFYKRCGYLLGIVYALQGSDFHEENMIASGDMPVLVDLETVIRVCDNTILSDIKHPQQTMYAMDSVTRTNLLPFLIQGKYYEAGNDAFTMQKKTCTNLPFLKGKYGNGRDFSEEICNGFCKMYDVISENHEMLSGKKGIPNWFSNCWCRFLMRGTRNYYLLQKAFYKAEFLKDRKKFEIQISKVEQLYDCLEGDKPAILNEIMETEKEDLRMGYIPRTALVLSREWPYTNLDKPITILQMVCNKFRLMNNIDKNLQCRRIKGALTAKNAGAGSNIMILDCNSEKISLNDSYLLLKQLMNSMVSDWTIQMQNRVIEGSVVTMKEHRYMLATLPWHLPEGLAGRLLPLAAWYLISKDSAVYKIIDIILNRMKKQISADDMDGLGQGLAVGIEGIVRMLQIFQLMIKDPRAEEIYYILIEKLVDRPLRPQDWLEEESAGLYYGKSASLYVLGMMAEKDLKNKYLDRIKELAQVLCLYLKEEKSLKTGIINGAEGIWLALYTALPYLDQNQASLIQKLYRSKVADDITLVDYSIGRGKMGRKLVDELYGNQTVEKIPIQLVQYNSLTFGNGGTLAVLCELASLRGGGYLKEEGISLAGYLLKQIVKPEGIELGLNQLEGFQIPSFLYGESGLLYMLIKSLYSKTVPNIFSEKQI